MIEQGSIAPFSGTPLLRVEGVRKRFGGVNALRGVGLEILSGEVHALLGENGAGKSTLIKILSGVHVHDGGSIEIDGKPVSFSSPAQSRDAGVAVVYQDLSLVESLSVADNLAFQSRISGKHDAAWQNELTERLGLGALLRRYPEQLSGGQQQRVAIGRALASKPLLLLADEPTGNLDEDTADEVLKLARDLVARTGCGFLMVTHSERLAATLDRHVHLHAGLIA